MFTGLIADLGEIEKLQRDGDSAILEIKTVLAPQIAPGDSVAVGGVCLTATVVDERTFTAHAIAETLRRSSLGSLKAGSQVNLELALAVNGRLGGHIVQGHVDGVARVSDVRERDTERVLELEVPEQLRRYLVHKGSVALDGVSLTISALSNDSLSVSLIPETCQRTTLGRATVGQGINLEVDVLAKHVERLLEHRT